MAKIRSDLMNSARSAMVLLSGGIDSAACAHFLERNGYSVSCMFVDYGQAPAGEESKASAALAERMGLTLTNHKVSPAGVLGKGEIRGRNAFLVMTALLLCDPSTRVISLGIHSGTAYYDCSPAFATLMDRVLAEYSDGCTRLFTPFLYWTKNAVVDYFRGSGLPIELTYSCEMGQPAACGVCPSCRDRRALKC
jgi:7-cyano-7-deazaguanine synthase